MITNKQLVDAYVEMVCRRVDAGWKPYLVTFMFDEIGGSPSHVSRVMQDEVERVYATILPRIVRHPRSAFHVWKCPVFIGCPDWPVPKHDRWNKQYILPNDGRHVHGIWLMPPISRLWEPLDDHFHEEQGRYVRPPLFHIHAVPITDDPGYVVRYGLKALERGRASPDDVIVLPRALSELRSRAA